MISEDVYKAGFITVAVIVLLCSIVSLIIIDGAKRYEISCDSGFKTPVTDYAETKYGHVIWREDGILHSRRIEDGEVCMIKEVKGD